MELWKGARRNRIDTFINDYVNQFGVFADGSVTLDFTSARCEPTQPWYQLRVLGPTYLESYPVKACRRSDLQ